MIDRYWWRLVLHASIFQHVGPFPACASVAMFQVLPEVVCPEELLALVALTKFVHMVEVFHAVVPVWRIHEFLTAVAAGIGRCRVK